MGKWQHLNAIVERGATFGAWKQRWHHGFARKQSCTSYVCADLLFPAGRQCGARPRAAGIHPEQRRPLQHRHGSDAPASLPRTLWHTPSPQCCHRCAHCEMVLLPDGVVGWQVPMWVGQQSSGVWSFMSFCNIANFDFINDSPCNQVRKSGAPPRSASSTGLPSPYPSMPLLEQTLHA